MPKYEQEKQENNNDSDSTGIDKKRQTRIQTERGKREETFTHSCTYRQRHVAACRKPWLTLAFVGQSQAATPAGLRIWSLLQGGVTGSSARASTLSSFSMPGRSTTPGFSPPLFMIAVHVTLCSPFGEALLSTFSSGSFHHFGAGAAWTSSIDRT